MRVRRCTSKRHRDPRHCEHVSCGHRACVAHRRRHGRAHASHGARSRGCARSVRASARGDLGGRPARPCVLPWRGSGPGAPDSARLHRTQIGMYIFVVSTSVAPARLDPGRRRRRPTVSPWLARSRIEHEPLLPKSFIRNMGERRRRTPADDREAPRRTKCRPAMFSRSRGGAVAQTREFRKSPRGRGELRGILRNIRKGAAELRGMFRKTRRAPSRRSEPPSTGW